MASESRQVEYVGCVRRCLVVVEFQDAGWFPYDGYEFGEPFCRIGSGYSHDNNNFNVI